MLAIKPILIHIISWCIGFGLTTIVASHSSVSVNYAIISGWWSACYFGYILNVRGISIPFAYIVFVFLFIVLYVNEVFSFHDMGDNIDIFMIIIVLGQGLVFVSPILVNEIIRVVESKCITRRST